jgi:hypothetical protein
MHWSSDWHWYSSARHGDPGAAVAVKRKQTQTANGKNDSKTNRGDTKRAERKLFEYQSHREQIIMQKGL